jgi:DNA-binding PadR family transcriptional regulator
MNFEHPLWQDLGRTAFAFGMSRRFGRGGHRHEGRIWSGEWPGERRARRGDVKFAILEVLAEQPRHGYDVIRELESRRGGGRPSAGSVYPTLQMLEDEGCVTSATVDGKRVYTITDAGRNMLARRPAEAGAEEDDATSESRHALREAAVRLGAAVFQAAREGDPIIAAKVRDILDRTRREVYAILGGDAPTA